MSQDKHSSFKDFTDSLESRLGRELSSAEILEIKQSLYHLGKAIYLFHLQKQGVKHE